MSCRCLHRCFPPCYGVGIFGSSSTSRDFSSVQKASASLVSFDSVEVSVGHADGFSASFVTLHGLVWSVVDRSARISFLRLRLKSASGASKSCATNVVEGPNQLLITL